jgi:hypothetical protein
MQRDLRKIQGNLGAVQEDLEYRENMGMYRKRGGGGDTGRFGMGDAERFKGDTGRSDGDTVRFR